LKEIRDQSAHAVACALALAPAMIAPSVASFTWAAFICGLIREVTEEGTPVTAAKVAKAIGTSKLDLFFWTLTGAILSAMLL
jgi:hypothetical protein